MNSKFSYLLLILCFIILVSGCESNRYKAAEHQYNSGNYAAAVEAFDHYISTGRNGAFVTKAELQRSDSYYQLGKMAWTKQNYKLAIRLLLLANSPTADTLLDKSYYTLAMEAQRDNQTEIELGYINDILMNIPSSPFVPELLHRKIKIAIEIQNDKATAWEIYRTLYSQFPENVFEVKARPLILSFIDSDIENIVAQQSTIGANNVLIKLFEIEHYPIGKRPLLYKSISDIYESFAEEKLSTQDYAEADRFFRLAVQYDPSREITVRKRIHALADLYIDKGNSFLRKREFQSAITYYKKAFDIIPDYSLAQDGIQRTLALQKNIQKAQEYAVLADEQESKRNYAEAMRLYRLAYALDKLEEYNRKANLQANIMEAEKNPESFARKIILHYQGGVLNRRIQSLKTNLLSKYKPNEVKDSGWKILLSPGQYKYEARYDILTPDGSYFYVWQINLKDKSIIPLNKLSEALMK